MSEMPQVSHSIIPLNLRASEDLDNTAIRLKMRCVVNEGDKVCQRCTKAKLQNEECIFKVCSELDNTGPFRRAHELQQEGAKRGKKPTRYVRPMSVVAQPDLDASSPDKIPLPCLPLRRPTPTTMLSRPSDPVAS
jgi:hypothetical protein